MEDKQGCTDCPWDGAQSNWYYSSTHPYIMKVNVKKQPLYITRILGVDT